MSTGDTDSGRGSGRGPGRAAGGVPGARGATGRRVLVGLAAAVLVPAVSAPAVAQAAPGPAQAVGDAAVQGLSGLAQFERDSGSTDLSAIDGISPVTGPSGSSASLGTPQSMDLYGSANAADTPVAGIGSADAPTGSTLSDSPAGRAIGAFYVPPEELPAEPGEIIRAEPEHLAWSVPGGGPDGAAPYPATATRIMYSSQDTHGAPNAVTGTFLRSTAPWDGPGQRPLIVIAPGTQGQGDACAPSKMVASLVTASAQAGPMVEYEMIPASIWLAKGANVVITDYEGLGTPAMHTYVNRKSEAHAVIDAARAAGGLDGAGVGPHTPIGIYGYSQGGGAAGAAAELLGTYGADIAPRVVGVIAGAPPADLAATLDRVDGTSLAGVIGYALNSMRAAYPDVIGPVLDAEINDRGRRMLDAVAQQCVGETAAQFGFAHTSEFTRTGESLTQVIARYPQVRAVLDDNNLGRIKPDVPVLVLSGSNDDIVPHGQAQDLADDWCALGANVRFDDFVEPSIIDGAALGHVIPMLGGTATFVDWMDARLAGEPAQSTCG